MDRSRSGGRAEFEIAIAGLGVARLDPEGDHGLLRRLVERGEEGGVERLLVRDQMVARRDEQGRARMLCFDVEGGGQDGGGGVAGHRLDDEPRAACAYGRDLVGGDEAQCIIGDHHRRGVARPLHAQQGLLKQAGLGLAEQLDELLGIALARQRPQPRA